MKIIFYCFVLFLSPLAMADEASSAAEINKQMLLEHGVLTNRSEVPKEMRSDYLKLQEAFLKKIPAKLTQDFGKLDDTRTQNFQESVESRATYSKAVRLFNSRLEEYQKIKKSTPQDKGTLQALETQLDDLKFKVSIAEASVKFAGQQKDKINEESKSIKEALLNLLAQEKHNGTTFQALLEGLRQGKSLSSQNEPKTQKHIKKIPFQLIDLKEH